MSIIDEAKRILELNKITQANSGKIFVPYSTLEDLIQEIEQIKEVSERRADLLLKAEGKIENMNVIIKPLIEVRKSYHQWLKPLEEIYFKKLMEIMKNNQSKVSVSTDLNRGTVRKKLKQFNLI